jgi:hypothetical protein
MQVFLGSGMGFIASIFSGVIGVGFYPIIGWGWCRLVA